MERVVTTQSQQRTAKPDVAIYRHTLEKLVADIAANIEAACAPGIDGIRFTTIEQLRNDLEAHGRAGKLPATK